jgi:hypothetical protein
LVARDGAPHNGRLKQWVREQAIDTQGQGAAHEVLAVDDNRDGRQLDFFSS